MGYFDHGVFSDDFLTVATFGWFETLVVPEPVGSAGWHRGKGRGPRSDLRTDRPIVNPGRSFRPTPNRMRRG